MSAPHQHPEDLDLVQGLREAIDGAPPLALLDAASMVLAATEHHPNEQAVGKPEPLVSRDDLVDSFCGAGLRETDALLRVWSQLIDDEATRRRILRAVEGRGLAVPSWLHRIDQVQPVRAVSISDVFGENETIFVEIATPIDSFTLAIAIFHNGPLLEDAYAIPLSFAAALAEIGLHDDELAIVRSELPLAGTRARVEQALRLTRMTVPPVETESWPGTGPLLEWMLRLMPEGGDGYESEEWPPERLAALVDELAASPHGARLSADQLAHAERLFDFQVHYGTGDPLRWGGMFVERLLCDLYPRKVLGPADFMESMPTALHAVVQYANERSGIPQELIDEVHEAIDAYEGEYLLELGEPHPAHGWFDDSFPGFDPFAPGSASGLQRIELHRLALIAGGDSALDTLDAAPLPPEPLQEQGIAADILPRVRRTAELVAEASGRFFADPEMTTASLRVLARVAASDPAIFRRRSKDETAAAAICWIAGRNNEWFTAQGDRSRTVQALMQSMGLSGSPTQRAEPMLRALGTRDAFAYLEIHLGDPALLVSERRRDMIAQRDRLIAELDGMG
ncbi:MAG: hypothetical protein QM606_09400 [Leucobacter sp.]